MKSRPELDIMVAKSKIEKGEPLLDESIINFLSFLKEGTGLELDGGLGLVSEHLSGRLKMRLCDDGRLYFTFRRQIFPKSSVMEMNITPNALSDKSPIVDYVIIHSPQWLDLAKKLAKKMVVTTYDLSGVNVGKYDEQIDINNTEVSREVTENRGNKKSNKKHSTNSDVVHDNKLSEPKPI
jgi:hypothetical protein